ncbi:hypothetical protein [Acetoanaerobium noterae]|uniref:hypothetical protein n=1 Tax=Acetoanaerobium noterae TaxID=745369 RepID=UPI0013566013|nr:hypothetical protein [Acetoanaerobium noterae]
MIFKINDNVDSGLMIPIIKIFKTEKDAINPAEIKMLAIIFLKINLINLIMKSPPENYYNSVGNLNSIEKEAKIMEKFMSRKRLEYLMTTFLALSNEISNFSPTSAELVEKYKEFDESFNKIIDEETKYLNSVL